MSSNYVYKGFDFRKDGYMDNGRKSGLTVHLYDNDKCGFIEFGKEFSLLHGSSKFDYTIFKIAVDKFVKEGIPYNSFKFSMEYLLGLSEGLDIKNDKLTRIALRGLVGDSSDQFDALRDILADLIIEDEYENMTYEELYEKYVQ